MNDTPHTTGRREELLAAVERVGVPEAVRRIKSVADETTVDPYPRVADQIKLPPDEELLKRAVKNSRSFHAKLGARHPRWVGVMETFMLGSTYSRVLCQRFGFDPDEEVYKGKP